MAEKLVNEKNRIQTLLKTTLNRNKLEKEDIPPKAVCLQKNYVINLKRQLPKMLKKPTFGMK